VALLAGVALAALAGLALAKTHRTTVKTAHNAALHETVVVDTRGHTLYHLSPETTHHLLCNSQTCFSFWPPYKVSKSAKLTKGKGVKAKLGRIHRHGFYQLTVGGVPVYHFSGDSSAGQANGNGIKSFGGTWHAVKASGSSKSTTTTTTSTTSSYSYPY
jgi:predicted lipoprotein with Yx(FWY)xxD motif